MPLIHSRSDEALHENVRRLIPEIGQSPHVQSRAQAIAIAESIKRRGKAGGGSIKEGSLERQFAHEGFLHSTVPGRTDKLPITVKGGAYVLPADHVSAIGQGNSLAGADHVNKMFKMGPYGTSPLKGSMKSSAPKLSFRKADGGETGEHGDTPIIAAGGEIVIPPEKIIEKFGDIDKGHKALDQWVVDTRKNHVKTLRNLKPPKKD